LRELKLGIGDKIKVYKANMIIPQIAENLTGSATATIPESCFVCGGETQIRKQRDGEALYCTNPECSAQRIQRLTHFVSRDAMNIEGLSEETIKKFLEKGFIEQYPDIFSVEKYKNEIENMDGFGEKSYQNLIKSMEKARNVELPNFIYALGINQVGLRNAKLLCEKFNYNLERIKVATEEELQEIDGFGAIIAHSINQYFQVKEHLDLLNQLLEFLNFKVPVLKEAKDSLVKGLTFVVTGDLSAFPNRKALAASIEARGGKVTGSVTKKTDYLINNDVYSSSSKNGKAKELGIPIISEADFIGKFEIAPIEVKKK
jgi:DNA ligase (NAD+)